MNQLPTPAHPLEPTKVYVINGIDVVPHHAEKGVYMAPGNIRILESYARSVATEVKELMLWKRP